MLYTIIFLYGLVIGSFLNVCIHRIPAGESLIKPPSHCPFCNYRLRILDLIPVLSFLFLRGRCRNCKKEISWRYPLIELLTGGLFLSVFFFQGFSVSSVFYCLLISALIALSFIDLEHYIIPDGINIFIFLLGIGYYIVTRPFAFSDLLIGALGTALFFFALILIYKDKMGGGDLKLAIALSIWLGWPNIALAVFLASFLGLIAALVLKLTRGLSFSTPIPFGPFLALGTYITILWGQVIWTWYLDILL